jgi:hypothetical protein
MLDKQVRPYFPQRCRPIISTIPRFDTMKWGLFM